MSSLQWLAQLAGVHNALLYTLIENCKLQRIDPERCLEDVIRELPSEPTAEEAAALTPRRYAARLRRAEVAA